MASRQQKRQPPRNTTNIVVRNGSSSNQAGPSRAQQARRRRNKRKPQVNIRVLANQSKNFRRALRRQNVGSRVVFQTITSTLGTVGSNGSDQIECEMTCLLNPATMRESTGVNAFGPVSIYASTYALWRMTRCELRLKPLVGASAISGTVVRASWNPTSTPSQTSWSALGARMHADVTPGKDGRFVLTAKNLKGPKDGWFKTNTKGDPMMCFAGTLELHTYGKTKSTYTNTDFNGGLFLAELVTHWQFKDYQQQPGMFNLLKGEDKSEARVEADANGKLQLIVPPTSRIARASSGPASEIIWLVTDTVIQVGTQFLGPFGWLIRGGWWLIKRAAGAPVRRDGSTTFDIYSSISDARAGVPCLNGQQPVNITVGGLHFQQITPGNIGVDDNIPMGRSIDYPSQGAPTQCFVTTSTMLKFNTTTSVPSACQWYSFGRQNHTTGIGFLSGGTQVATYNIHEVTVTTDTGPIHPSMFSHQVPIYLFANERHDLGFAVASSYERMNETPSLWVSNVLFYATNNREHAYGQNWRITKVTYPATNGGADYQVEVANTNQAQSGNVNVRIQQGKWYVAQYVVQGTIDGQYYVGSNVVASHGTETTPTTTRYFTPRVDDINMGLMPVYMSGLHLDVFETNEVIYSQSRSIAPLGDLDPAFGCDDALDFPPPPSEEDLVDDEDEFEDPEDLEEDEDEELELGPDDDYSDPPMSRLVVHPDAQQMYEQLRAHFPERESRLAANQLKPSDEYSEFTELYHNAIVDGLSPRAARAYALGL
ncbi:MAG: ORF2 [Xinjiang mamastrovirus 1]|nr:MAG: ORF2 [Xinjiang mamastrovirus 1]